ncbi:hypothetical protein D3C86_1318340 [compost metagenome]
MTFFGKLPECLSSTVNVLQLLSISMAFVSKDIWSVESTVTLHSAAINWLLASVNRDTATSLANMVNLQGRVIEKCEWTEDCLKTSQVHMT